MASVSKIWINGVTGRMGQLIKGLIVQAPDLDFGGGSALALMDPSSKEGTTTVTADTLAAKLTETKVDGIIDFSTAEGNRTLIDAIGRLDNTLRPPVLVGTTGLAQAQLNEWQNCTGLSLLIAPNTSLGILTLAQLTRQLGSYLPKQNFDIEIVETHHKHKVDAPSGTARFLASTATDANPQLTAVEQRSGKRKNLEVGVHAVRGGSVFGEHEVRFLGEQEEISLSHRAFSRELFASGALTLTRWLLKQPAGVYSLFDVDLAKPY